MRVILHAGVHFTDEDKLLKALRTNQDMLNFAGVSAPPPNTYRKQLRDMIAAVRSLGMASEPSFDATSLFEAASDTDRLVLSSSGFFGSPRMAVKSGKFYPDAEHRIDAFQSVFDGLKVELYIGIRNPASFLPALRHKIGSTAFDARLAGTDTHFLRWSELVLRLRDAFPVLPITVWCNEDTPLIWAEILRELSGVSPMEKLYGEYSLLSEILTDEGMKRFSNYLANNPSLTELQIRRITVVFLEKYAREDAIEEEVDLLGWTDEIIEELTELYEDDVDTISRIPGLRLLVP